VIRSLAADGAALAVLLDPRHPLAYLALHPTLALEAETGVVVDWLPLTAPTLRRPRRPGRDADRGTLHRWHRAHAIAREIEVYGAAQGLVLREPYRDGPADSANLGWLWMRDRHRGRLAAYLVEVFRAYWSGRLDPSDPVAVASIVEGACGDASGFLAWSKGEGPAQADEVDAAARKLGLYQVPAYVVEDEVYYGRQHLPMIRWILGGRLGAPPV
jgi:2-hydroxychromene-2-carboxylate isomerase